MNVVCYEQVSFERIPVYACFFVTQITK